MASSQASGANTGFTFNASNSPNTLAAFQSGGTSRFVMVTSATDQMLLLNGNNVNNAVRIGFARNSATADEGNIGIATGSGSGFTNTVAGDIFSRAPSANAWRIGPGTTGPSIAPFSITATFSGDTLLTSVLTAGAAPASFAGNGTDATDATLQGSAGGATSGTLGRAAGDGSSVGIDAGNGGDAPFGSTNGDAGDVPLRPGKPGAGLGSAGADGAVRIAYQSGSIGAPLEFAGGSTPSLSASNEGRIFYNSSTQTFQGSANGAAFSSLTFGGITAPTVNNVRVITATGASDLTLTAGTEAILVYAVAGGGAGGSTASGATTSGAGGAGGSGSGAWHYITNPAAGYDVVVGLGGAAAVAGDNDGGTGGITTLAADGGAVIFTCNAGLGGGGSAAEALAALGGLGGAGGAVSTGATANFAGTAGTHGVVYSGTSAASGVGGGSMFGGGAAGVTGDSAGITGGNYGSGGSGACQTGDGGAAAGGAGAPGVLIVVEFK